MDILCSGPGPHDPVSGVLGQGDQPITGLLCPLCAALAAANPPTPMGPDLVTIANQVSNLNDAVNLLILNTLGT